MPQNEQYCYEMDIVRFLAAFLISLTCHYAGVYHVAPHDEIGILHFLYQKAGYFVETFFMISGFFMYRQYSDRIVHHQISFSGFILRRVKRIYPLMILTSLVAFLGQRVNISLFGFPAILSATDGRNSLLALLLSCLGLQCGWIDGVDSFAPNGASWFVSVLMVCYCLFFFVAFFSRGSKTRENIGYAALVLLGLVLYFHPVNAPLLYMNCGRGYLSFFLGALLHQIIYRFNRNTSIAMGFIGIFLYVIGYQKDILWNDLVMFALLFDVSLLFLVCNLRLSFPDCINKFTKTLGKVSFSVFMWNIPIYIYIVLVGNLLGCGIAFGSMKMLILSNLAVLAISIIGYYFFERKWAS